jgi:hypothetical protein
VGFKVTQSCRIVFELSARRFACIHQGRLPNSPQSSHALVSDSLALISYIRSPVWPLLPRYLVLPRPLDVDLEHKCRKRSLSLPSSLSRDWLGIGARPLQLPSKSALELVLRFSSVQPNANRPASSQVSRLFSPRLRNSVGGGPWDSHHLTDMIAVIEKIILGIPASK